MGTLLGKTALVKRRWRSGGTGSLRALRASGLPASTSGVFAFPPAAMPMPASCVSTSADGGTVSRLTAFNFLHTQKKEFRETFTPLMISEKFFLEIQKLRSQLKIPRFSLSVCPWRGKLLGPAGSFLNEEVTL